MLAGVVPPPPPPPLLASSVSSARSVTSKQAGGRVGGGGLGGGGVGGGALLVGLVGDGGCTGIVYHKAGGVRGGGLGDSGGLGSGGLGGGPLGGLGGGMDGGGAVGGGGEAASSSETPLKLALVRLPRYQSSRVSAPHATSARDRWKVRQNSKPAEEHPSIGCSSCESKPSVSRGLWAAAPSHEPTTGCGHVGGTCVVRGSWILFTLGPWLARLRPLASSHASKTL